MSLDIYNDAFKSLSFLNENLFDTSTLGVQKLQSFLDDDLDGEDEIEIIDAEANTQDDLSDSYVGKVIVDCNVCHSHIFKDKEDIDIDDSGLVNGEDACPYCGEQEGFVIIGEIAPYGESEETEDDMNDIDEVPTEDEEELTESLNKDTDESLSIGAGAALGGAAIGAGILGASMLNEGDDLDELLDVKLDARGFGGSGNNVHVGPGSMPLTASCKRRPAKGSSSLNESPEGDDLATKVLRHLDELEARGELTEDINDTTFPEDFANLDRYINRNRSVIVATNNNYLSHNMIKRYLTHKLGKHVCVVDGLTFTMDDPILGKCQSGHILVVDDFDRMKPVRQSELIKYLLDTGVAAVLIHTGNNKIDNAVAHRFPMVRIKGVTNDTMTESMNNVKVETDDNIVTVNSDESGKVTVTTEPMGATTPSGEGEMMVPLSDEEMNSMLDSDIMPTDDGMSADVDFGEGDDMPLGDDEIDVDMEEIDEESMDDLGESYLRKVYENVKSYKTTNSYVRDNKIILEGVITFTSGTKKTTGFILESHSANRYGKVSFTGYNSHLTNNKSAYLFEGKVKDKRLIMEKLTYKYRLNENLIKGRVCRK